MQITATYLDWQKFSTLAGDDFEARWIEACESDERAPGQIALDKDDNSSDSFIAFAEAGEFLNRAVAPGSAWRTFVDHAFLAVARGEPTPRNDLGCAVNPEAFAAILSPASVRAILGAVVSLPLPATWVSSEHAGEIERWLNIWRKALKRGLGISYHLG